MCEPEKFYVNPTLVDLEQHKRDVADDANKPAKRIERLLQELDDPDTQFGKLDVVTRVIIKELAAGTKVKDVTEAVGLCRRQIGRKLKGIHNLKEQSFNSVLRSRVSHV